MNSVDQFAKTLNKIIEDRDSKKPTPKDDRVTVTKVEGDTVWVHFPGGVDETPVQRTLDAKVGDTVTVRRAEGKAWITGNNSSPPTDDTTANYAVDITNNLSKDVVVLNTVVAENIEATNARFNNVEADTAKIHDLTADQLTASVGYIADLTADHITADDISADHATVGSLNTNYAHITNGTIDNAKIGYADVDGLNANYAQIDAANVTDLSAQNAWVNKIMVQTGLLAHEGTVFTLDAIQVNAANITAGTLDVNRLIVTVGEGSSAQKYLVNIDPSTGTPSYEKLDGNIVAPRTITADKIVAGAITTNEITANNLVGTSGWINLHEGKFFYGDGANFASATNAISWNGSKLQIKADEFLLSTGQTIQDSIESVENWFYSVPPTTSNPPASSWTTTNLKEQHLRDIYFDTTSGKSYRWAKEGSTYKWVEIEDVELSALARDLHDNYPPYSEFTVQPDQIAIEVGKKVGTNEVIAKINASTEGVQIKAAKVDIAGAAIFNNYSTTQQMNEAIGGAVDGIEIGGRNLFGLGSKCESLDGFTIAGTWNIVTEDGFKCAHTTAELNTTKYIKSAIPFTPKPLEKVTFSAYVKAKNIAQGSTNPMNSFYFSGGYVSDVWRGCLYYDAYVDGEFVKHSGSLSGVYFSALINDSKWHHIAVVATFDDANFTGDLAPYIYVRDCTGDIYIRDIKYERGTKATDWTPAPEDVQADMDNIQVGGRNLIRDSYFDVGLAKNIAKNVSLSYGSWLSESRIDLGYDSIDECLVITSNNADSPNTAYGIFQDVKVNPNTDYVLSLDTHACYVGYRFLSDDEPRVWPADSSGWSTLNGRTYKVINSGNNTRCRVYVYTTYEKGATKLQRIKLEAGNKPTDWTPAPEDANNTHGIHTVDCIAPDASYTYSQLIGWSSRTDALQWNVTSTSGIKVGDTVRLGITASDMGSNGTKVYLVATVTSIAEATRLYAISKGLDTTVIDGGHILTGQIDANRMNANVINAVNNGNGQINADKINASQINIGDLAGEIGGRNLIRRSLNLADFIQESANCPTTVYPDYLLIKHTADNTTTYGAYYDIPLSALEAGAKYTLSFNAISPPTSARFSVGDSNNAWAGITGYRTAVAGRNEITFTAPSGVEWIRIYLSIFTYNQEFKVSHIKLEKGVVATDWTPAPEDLESRQKINVKDLKIENATYVTTSISGESITLNRIGATGNWGVYYDYPCDPNSYYTVSAKVEAGVNWGITFGTATVVQDGVSTFSGLSVVRNNAGVGGYYIASNSVKTYPNEKYIRVYFCSSVSGASWTLSDITIQKGAELSNSSRYITHIDNNGIQIHPSSTTADRIQINGSAIQVYKNNSLRATFSDEVHIQTANGTYPKVGINASSAWLSSAATTYADMRTDGLNIVKDNVSVAFYGDDARIGKADKSRVYITADNGMRVYDKNNKRRLWLDWDGFFIYDDSEANMSSFTPSYVRIGKDASGHSTVKSDGLHVWTGTESTATNEVAFFGATARIGKSNSKRVELDSSSFAVVESNGIAQFSVDATSDSLSRSYTRYLDLTGDGFIAYARFVAPGIGASIKVGAATAILNVKNAITTTLTLPTTIGATTTVTANNVTFAVSKEGKYVYELNASASSGTNYYAGFTYTTTYREALVSVNDSLINTQQHLYVPVYVSSGTLDDCTITTWGRVAQIRLEVHKSSVASGSNVFEGILSDFIPIDDALICGYYGGRACPGKIDSGGEITVRNAGSSSVSPTASSPLIVLGTYIFDPTKTAW